MNRDEFEKLVEEQFARLPAHIVERLQNLGIVLEDEPTEEQLEIGLEEHDPESTHAEGMEGDDLLGLYEGLPLNERGGDYSGALPDKISLFQGPLERLAEGDMHLLSDEIYETLLHEIGHHFGFCEDDVQRLEDKRADSYNQ